MGTQKHRVSFQEENYHLAEAVHKMYGFKNVSELINSALEEWLVKKTTKQASRYLSKEVAQIIESTVGEFTRKTNHILFKLAVSDAELKHVIADSYTTEEDYLPRIRKECEQEIRVLHGFLELGTAISRKERNREWQD